jgi:hypothetical protein
MRGRSHPPVSILAGDALPVLALGREPVEYLSRLTAVCLGPMSLVGKHVDPGSGPRLRQDQGATDMCIPMLHLSASSRLLRT